jgi:hypothetical protein
VWCVLHHGSAQVAFKVYQDLLERASLLVPRRCTVILLADRGFADTELMAYLQRLGWHWRMALVGFQGLILTWAPETRNAFIRLLENKSLKEDSGRTNRVVRHGFIHDPGIQQEPFRVRLALWQLMF